MPSDSPGLRLLLDEHYPGWLADALVGDGLDAVALIRDRPELCSADDTTVLRGAAAESRVVVTEDVNTFAAAIAQVPDHVGVVYCHPARFPRTRPGLHVLRTALVALSKDVPDGLGQHPVEWWLSRASARHGS